MIEAKVQIPNKFLIYKYNKNYDILDVFIEKVIPSISEELYDGLYNYIDIETDAIVGLSIEDYTKRDKEFIKDYLSFDIDFDYVDKNITNLN